MLSSSQRLSRRQVTALLADPQLKVVFNHIGTFKYILSSNSALTVVTGSKQQKKAVLRNKVRRRIYSLFTVYQKQNIVGILYVSKQIYTMSYQEIKNTFHALLSKTEKTF